MTDAPAGAPARRGRVVMLVDNGIDGDSRVQKSAASIAAAGWETYLVGRSPTGREQRYQIGEATVIRVPVPFTIEAASRRPGHSPRWPLAYPGQDVASAAHRRQEARQRDVATRLATLKERAQRGAPRPELLRLRADLAVGRAGARAGRVWTGVRSRDFTRAVTARRSNAGLPERVAARAWQVLLGDRVWERLEPRLLDYENAYAPVIDALAPDIVHGHDYRMSGIAVRAARRARAKGRPVKAIYDAHEFLPGIIGVTPIWHIPYLTYEAAHITAADGVITVSPVIADMLRQRHHLPVTPTVVVNAPLLRDDGADIGDVRANAGVPDGAPLLLYVGAAAVKRGLGTVVEALPRLPDCHAVLVSAHNAYVDTLRRDAERLGVADRLHVLPYVDPGDVVRFIRTADVGLVPFLRQLNHDISYVTKFFEYAHARLPVVLAPSDLMAEKVREIGNGELYDAGDVEGFVAAVRAVLADPERYRKAYDGHEDLLAAWTWAAQERVLVEFYDRLAAVAPGTPVPPVPPVGT